jgi:hypothetical protein
MSAKPKGKFIRIKSIGFKARLTAADPSKALLVAVHHPPFSGDTEHSGSSAVYEVLCRELSGCEALPNLILSGHVHNYQRFTEVVQGPKGKIQLPYVVAGAGGYTNLGTLHTVNGAPPPSPLSSCSGLTLEQYDQTNFGFLRLEVSKNQIVGTYLSAPYVAGGTPAAKVVDTFTINLANNTVATGTAGKSIVPAQGRTWQRSEKDPGQKFHEENCPQRKKRQKEVVRSLSKGSARSCRTSGFFPDTRGRRADFTQGKSSVDHGFERPANTWPSTSWSSFIVPI